MTKKQLEAALSLAQEQLALNIKAWAKVYNDPVNPANANIADERFTWNCIVAAAINGPQ